MKNSFNDWLSTKHFDVEHALSLYASSYCTLPAEFIYDKKLLLQYDEVIKDCHIYLIGYLPKIDIEDIFENSYGLEVHIKVANNKKTITFPIPNDYKLVNLHGDYFLEHFNGKESICFQEALLRLISENIHFEVKYIGQAYGKDGSRNALDRLRKHETLQKISLLLLSVDCNNEIITMLNPRAKEQDNGSRIESGLKKLFNTTEQERISLFEASLIRYFYPEFNKEFKNSFPSTNLKILQDCYDKDFSAIFASICIDELPFKLFSQSVPATYYHSARHDLYDDTARQAFFNSDNLNG